MPFSGYTSQLSLADRFRVLVKNGTPLIEAPVLLFDLYIARYFHLMGPQIPEDAPPLEVPEEVPLPEITGFRLGEDGNLVVELADGGTLDPEQTLTREPHFFDRPKIPLCIVQGLRRAKTEPLREHGGHALDDVLGGWLGGGRSLPWVQECLVRLIANREIEIVPPLGGGWKLARGRKGRLCVELPVLGDVMPYGADFFRCYLSDPQLLDPDFLSRHLAPPPAVKEPPTAPTNDAGTEPVPYRGGRPTEHPWEDAARYVDEWIRKAGHLLRRHPNGTPNVQHAIDLMKIGFKKAEDPKPPSDRAIREWIRDHPERTNKWW